MQRYNEQTPGPRGAKEDAMLTRLDRQRKKSERQERRRREAEWFERRRRMIRGGRPDRFPSGE